MVSLLKICSSSVAGVLMIAATVCAHSGGTDSRGGHYNRKTGTYHYHGSSSSSSGSIARSSPRMNYRTSARTTSRSRSRYEGDEGQARLEAALNRKEQREQERRKQREQRLAEAAQRKKQPISTVEAEVIDPKKEKAEAAAKVELDLARRFLDTENRQIAKRRVLELISKYPQTTVAVEARQLLLPEEQLELDKEMREIQAASKLEAMKKAWADGLRKFVEQFQNTQASADAKKLLLRL